MGKFERDYIYWNINNFLKLLFEDEFFFLRAEIFTQTELFSNLTFKVVVLIIKWIIRNAVCSKDRFLRGERSLWLFKDLSKDEDRSGGKIHGFS